MKTLINSVIAICTLFLYNHSTYAQFDTTIHNQNPRHAEAERKYAPMADSLTKNQGTTIQQTYKAFDWYEDKMERKRQRELWRHLERMERAKYGYYYNDYYYNGCYSNYYSPCPTFTPYTNYRGNYWGFGTSCGTRF
ncbi:MAG: hypothetical protein ACQPRJ_06245 [Solitalea-like symbiont of Acarus siro]